MNRVTREFKAAFAERVQQTGENPLLLLLDIAGSDNVKAETKVRALDVLLSYTMPKKLELGGPDDGDDITEERIATTRRIFAQMFITEVTEVR
jgi:hypothetical protein